MVPSPSNRTFRKTQYYLEIIRCQRTNERKLYCELSTYTVVDAAQHQQHNRTKGIPLATLWTVRWPRSRGRPRKPAATAWAGRGRAELSARRVDDYESKTNDACCPCRRWTARLRSCCPPPFGFFACAFASALALARRVLAGATTSRAEH